MLRSLVLPLAWVVVAGTLGSVRVSSSEGVVDWNSAAEFSFSELNRTYQDLASDFAPIEQGALTLTLSSPRQTVVLKSHSVKLVPLADGSFQSRLALEVLGKGWIEGDLDIAGRGTRLQDELLLPQQTLLLEGRLRIDQAPALGGYKITALSMPGDVEVVIQSEIARGLVTWCDRIALLPWSQLDCVGFERSLTRVQVPLPPAGESYILPYEELSAEDRARLDAFLASAS